MWFRYGRDRPWVLDGVDVADPSVDLTANADATATGISNSALSRKLKGEAPIWTEQLIRIAAELRIDPASLLTAALARQDAGAVAA